VYHSTKTLSQFEEKERERRMRERMREGERMLKYAVEFRDFERYGDQIQAWGDERREKCSLSF
jgi:hypothetical protein